MDNITSIFKEKKLKLTPQRLAVYLHLMGTKEHPSAEAIYKALKTLVEVGLVQEINVGEGNFRYDATVDDHAHIQCLKCGKVDDLTAKAFPDLNQIAEENSKYKIQWNKLFFYGVCEDCQ